MILGYAALILIWAALGIVTIRAVIGGTRRRRQP